MMVGGTVCNTLKGGGTAKRRGETKILKTGGGGGRLGQGVDALKRKGLEPLTNYGDNLWQASWHFRNSSNYRPDWSGFMQNISKGEYSDQSKIMYLPIIDLNPTKEKCIYSTLLFIQEQAKKLNIVAPCLTFDKPL